MIEITELVIKPMSEFHSSLNFSVHTDLLLVPENKGSYSLAGCHCPSLSFNIYATPDSLTPWALQQPLQLPPMTALNATAMAPAAPNKQTKMRYMPSLLLNVNNFWLSLYLASYPSICAGNSRRIRPRSPTGFLCIEFGGFLVQLDIKAQCYQQYKQTGF